MLLSQADRLLFYTQLTNLITERLETGCKAVRVIVTEGSESWTHRLLRKHRSGPHHWDTKASVMAASEGALGN